MRAKSSSACAYREPKTASASDLPYTWAIPQLSRTILTFLASLSQRALSLGPAWTPIAALIRHSARKERRFIASIVPKPARFRPASASERVVQRTELQLRLSQDVGASGVRKTD